MLDKLKSLGATLLGIAILLAVLALPLVFIKGVFWATEYILDPLITVGWFALAIILLILLPVSLFRRLREFCGSFIYLSSYIFGLICWLYGFVVTYDLWGLWAVIVGILFLGGGVVPIGMVASLFKGEWEPLITLVILTAITFGTRIGGVKIAEKG